MVVFPNCKINLGLNIISKRMDGYHDLETVFFPVAVKDALEVITFPTSSFETSGLPVDGKPEDNICMKAFHLLKADFRLLPEIKTWLHKAIPMGAGLGGGSADGAFMLMLLNKKYQLNLTPQQLVNYSIQLGSDCPFFITNEPVFATGRGELMEKIAVDLSGYQILIVNPNIHISTKEAFSKLIPGTPFKSVREIIQQPLVTWKNDLVNDFEKAVFPMYPAIKKLKDDLYNAGAVYASMTGSGSTVFGIYPKNHTPLLKFSPGYVNFLVPAQ